MTSPLAELAAPDAAITPLQLAHTRAHAPLPLALVALAIPYFDPKAMAQTVEPRALVPIGSLGQRCGSGDDVAPARAARPSPFAMVDTRRPLSRVPNAAHGGDEPTKSMARPVCPRTEIQLGALDDAAAHAVTAAARAASRCVQKAVLIRFVVVVKEAVLIVILLLLRLVLRRGVQIFANLPRLLQRIALRRGIQAHELSAMAMLAPTHPFTKIDRLVARAEEDASSVPHPVNHLAKVLARLAAGIAAALAAEGRRRPPFGRAR